MYKQFKPGDIEYIQQNVSSKVTLNGNSGGIKTTTYHSQSTNEESRSYYNSLNQLFYKKHYCGGNSGFTGTGIYYSHTQDRFTNPQFKNKFYNEGVLYSISSSKYGKSVKPGTLKLTDTTEPYPITIKDDGYGNLYPTNAEISQSGTTSISSSDNYVGNVFYEHGLVVLTDTGSFAGAWDLSEATLEGEGPNMSSENNLPHGIFFKPDGTRYFMIGSQGSAEGIFEYLMTTPWDVSTATYTGNKLDLTNPNWTADAWRSITFSADGYKIWTTNEDADQVKEWNLDIAWDITSWDSSAKGSMTNFATDGISATIENQPHGHAFSYDGLKLYVVGAQKNTVFEYDLQDAYSIANVSYNSKSFNISESINVNPAHAAEGEINGISFKPDGTRMFTAGNGRNMVYEHRLSTAWDVSTATFYASKSISSEETQIHDVQWKPDGSKMYIIGHGTDAVHQYNVTSGSYYTNLGTNYSLEFDNMKTIDTLRFKCIIEPHEYNMTMNPTILSASNPLTTSSFNDSRQFGQFSYIGDGGLDGEPSYYQSGSITNITDGTIKPVYRKNEFRTYITTIGFYNDHNELIMVGKFPQPVKKVTEQPMTIIVEMDF